MGFKAPDDFARYLTIGAHAAAAITADLENTHGHRIIELERYARANKVWSVKVKRMRLPDLLCIRCGRRFESKGKTSLVLKLSDSASVGREWFAGGMREDDVFGFARVALTDAGAEVGQVVYVTRRALHDATDALVQGQRKAVADGSETDVSWPSWTAKQNGVVTSAGADAITILKDDGKSYKYRGHTKWPNHYRLVDPGERFAAGDIIVSSVAPADVQCAGDTWDWVDDIESADADTRFAAVKAARWLSTGEADEALRAIVEDPDSDWRLAIEATASLAPRDALMIHLLHAFAVSNQKEGAPMEAVFVLTELSDSAAVDALEAIAQNLALTSEVRAAAVWGIGLGAGGQVNRLLPYLADADELVALHAGAALPGKLPESLRDGLVGWLDSGDLRRVASAAHALARRGEVETLVGRAISSNGDRKALMIRALGDLQPSQVEPLLVDADETTQTALWAIWIRERDWLRSDTTDGGLDILEKQRLVL